MPNDIAIEDDKMRKHSILIDGHQTSISLEDAFWHALGAIAKRRGQSVNTLVGAIDHARTTNLSSAVRVFVLNQVQRPDNP